MKQNNTIDLAKFISALLIIVLHTYPLLSYSTALSFGLRNIITPIAVPFFFISSGYILETKLNSFDNNLDRKNYFFKWAKRVLFMYLFWSAVYFVFVLARWVVQGFNLASVLIYIKNFFLEGSYLTIWYLLALLVGGGCLFLLRLRFNYKKILIISCVIYCFTLLGTGYYNLTIKLPIIGAIFKAYYVVFDTMKNGLFFALIFMAIGGAFANSKKLVLTSKKLNILLIVIAWILLAVEQFIISKFGLGNSCDTVLFLVPLSVLLFNLVLSINLPDKPIYLLFRKLSVLMFLTQRIPLSIIEMLFRKTILYTNSLIFFIVVLAVTFLISCAILKLSEKIKFFKKIY